MSLVAYGCSDDSDDEIMDEEPIKIDIKTKNTVKNKIDGIDQLENVPLSSNKKLDSSKTYEVEAKTSESEESNIHEPLRFNSLPKPSMKNDYKEIDEDNDDIPVSKLTQIPIEKPPKRERGPVKISIPSLSDFKDVDEEMDSKKNPSQASKRGTGLFAVLPSPSGTRTISNFVPHVLTKTPASNTSLKPSQVKKPPVKSVINTVQNPMKKVTNALNSLKYDSNSEDEDEIPNNSAQKNTDFFSLSKPLNPPMAEETIASNLYVMKEPLIPMKNEEENNHEMRNSTLTSSVMNLPRDEIILKNKAEVGPKLPVPEQEYHLDAAGNVAFDEKAIEYLCGKRGVKRKNELLNETSIIDINGEDIKPDERDWLVKALTEEPVQRSMGSGPSGQSKKKHQITYLAHQAKAMEVELQNQWASNRLARKQTQSKYGF